MFIFFRHKTRSLQLQCRRILEPEGSLPVPMLQTCFQSKYAAEKAPLKGSGPSQGKLSIRHGGRSPLGMLLWVSLPRGSKQDSTEKEQMAEGFHVSSGFAFRALRKAGNTRGEEPERSISTLTCAMSCPPSQLSYLEHSSLCGYREEPGKSKIPIFTWRSSMT